MRPLHSFSAFLRKTPSCFCAISLKVLTMTGPFIYFIYCYLFFQVVVYHLNCLISSEQLLVLVEYVPFGDLLGYLRKSRGLRHLLQRPGYQTTGKSDVTAADELCLANCCWNELLVLKIHKSSKNTKDKKF